MEVESLMASNSKIGKRFGTKTRKDGYYSYISYSEEKGGF